MIFKLCWEDDRGPGYVETYDTSSPSFAKIKSVEWTGDPEQWCRDIVAWFNRTLRPGELPRRLAYCEVVSEDGEVLHGHKWVKVSLATQSSTGGRSWDNMRCSICGVTGKRFSLGASGVKIDSKYRLKKYRTCNWYLEKKTHEQ